MDSLITAAARALAAGDPVAALKRVALRDDAPALALRGIAMAQLGEFARAKTLLQRAARAFGPNEIVARARCVVAGFEIALVSRDLHWSTEALEAAIITLEEHGDLLNAAHARYLAARRLLLIGHVDEAERKLVDLDPGLLPPALQTAHQLVTAGIAIRRLRTNAARAAIIRAEDAVRNARIPALKTEVERAALVLSTPAARLLARGQERPLLLAEVEALLQSNAVIVDACRQVVRRQRSVISLAGRPLLFALAQTLVTAWPADVSRDVLLARAFGAKLTDESHRARLRVEVARLRRLLRGVIAVNATRRGFAFSPDDGCEVVFLTWLGNEEHAALLAFLADGELWSSSALALALGMSQRTVQRTLDVLSAAGRVQPFGHGRARRWLTPPIPHFATTLLLPNPLPVD